MKIISFSLVCRELRAESKGKDKVPSVGFAGGCKPPRGFGAPNSKGFEGFGSPPPSLVFREIRAESKGKDKVLSLGDCGIMAFSFPFWSCGFVEGFGCRVDVWRGVPPDTRMVKGVGGWPSCGPFPSRSCAANFGQRVRTKIRCLLSGLRENLSFGVERESFSREREVRERQQVTSPSRRGVLNKHTATPPRTTIGPYS